MVMMIRIGKNLRNMFLLYYINSQQVAAFSLKLLWLLLFLVLLGLLDLNVYAYYFIFITFKIF